MMMDGNSTCVGEEWTWNIVIETMNKLTIEIKNPADKMKTKEQKERLIEAFHGSSTTSQAPFYPVQFPKNASKDPSKTFNTQCNNQGGLEDGFFSFDYSGFDDCFLKYI